MTGTPEGGHAAEPSAGVGPVNHGHDDLAGLLGRCARGDEAAFGAVYDATAPRIYGLALRVIRDPAQAEEVTQEIYLEIWRHSARYRPDSGHPLSWMLTIAHRRAVDRVRAAEAGARRDTAYDAKQAITLAGDSTADLATASLEARQVRKALATLTPAQREAIELAYYGGYTHAEVATMLNLPIGTAKTRIRDGLIRLRDAMGVGA